MLPRVFISSTFYDLKYVREELADFVQNYNFEPVLFERGDVGYEHGEYLDASCYREICNSDMVVLVIGGRYGSPATGEAKDKFKEYLSITRKEFNTAVESNIPVYVFVESNVYSEYFVYVQNKEQIENHRVEIKFAAADNINVFRFIDSIYSLDKICVTGFSTTQNIKEQLRKQWADMFKQHLLSLRERKSREKMIDSMTVIEGIMREMNIMVQRMGEKVIGADDSMLESVLEIQKIDKIAGIIANSVDFIACSQSLEQVKVFMTSFVNKIIEGCRANIFIKLFSEDDNECKEVYDFLEGESPDIYIANISEELGISLAAYKNDLLSGRFDSLIIEKLMQKEFLKKMNIPVRMEAEKNS